MIARHALFALLLLAACSGEQDDNSSDRITVTGQSAPRPAGPAPAEARGQDFVATVLGAYRFVGESARLAREKAEQPKVKAFAEQLSGDIDRSRAELEGLARSAGLDLTPAPGETHETDLAVLSSTRGAPLELAFAEQQIEALTLLVGLIRAYKNGGDNPQLKAWAETNQAIVNDRLMDLQTLNAELQTAALPPDQR